MAEQSVHPAQPAQPVQREILRSVNNGYFMLLPAIFGWIVPLLLGGVGIGFLEASKRNGGGIGPIVVGLGLLLAAAVLGLAWILVLCGFIVVNPNEARVLQLFGAYKGTVRDPGLKWANPFYSKASVSLRVRNFESSKLKVNDHSGNPIEIAAVVVWRVIDTAEAVFEVDDYNQYVHVQSEAALRNLATQYPYDDHEESGLSLRGSTQEIAAQLQREVQDRLGKAGVEVIEARISHLAYAPEIAGVMLQRQQASAIIAARQKIVEGAVGMVEMALARLDSGSTVQLDGPAKARMVSNLLVVLCGERATQPVVSTDG